LRLISTRENPSEHFLPQLNADPQILFLKRMGKVYPSDSSEISFQDLLNYIFLLLIGLCFSGLASGSTHILVLQSHNSLPYQQALDGFKSSLNGHGLDVEYDVHIVSNDTEAEALWPLIQNHPPKLILTLGTPAMRASLARERSIPVLAGLILNTDELKQYPNATGVGLSFPPALQWLWLRRLLPEARQIALLYDPNHGSLLFQSLQKLALAENVTLIPAPVASPEDLPRRLQDLPTQLDALWAIDNVSAFNTTKVVQELLLYSFRNRTPLIGLSAQWAKAGAIYALDWDYSDLGAQTAELAWVILHKGASPSSLQPIEPRKIRPVLNVKTAAHMKLQISNEWLPEIGEVLQ
jgi:putative ABC transport system substrate-binding protein